MLICKICKIEKCDNDFYIRSDSKLHRKECKICIRRYKKEYYISNRSALLKDFQDYRSKNREVIRIRDREYGKKYPEKIRQSKKRYYQKNPEKIKAKVALWVEKNPEKRKANSDRWTRNNPAKVNARTAKRRAALLCATPKWLTKQHLKDIEYYYLLAKELRWLSEEPLEVDHIIPLRGKNISGLHVPWNLQILPESTNLKKLNKF